MNTRNSIFKITGMLKFAILLGIVFVSSCNETKESKTRYAQPPALKLDSTTMWLFDFKHVNDPTFTKVFQTHLEKQIQAKNTDSIFKIIQYTIEAIASNYSFDTAIIHQTQTILTQNEKELKPKFRVVIYSNLAKIYQNVMECDSSIYFARMGFVTIEDFTTAREMGNIYNALTACYTKQAQYDSAIFYGHKAEEIFQQQELAHGLGACYDNMAGIYANLNDFENQELYLNKAIGIAKEANIENGILISYINRMGFKVARDDYKSALLDADTVLNYVRQFKTNEPMISIISYGAKSFLSSKNGNLSDGKKYLDTAQTFLKIEPQYAQLDFYRLALLENSKENKQLGSNKPIFDQMLLECQEINDFAGISNVAEFYYDLAVKNNNYKEALKYKLLENNAHDSLRQEAQQQLVYDLDKKYQTAKKEKQILEQKSKLQKSKFQIGALLATLVGILLSVFIFLGYRKRKEVQQEIKRQEEFTKQLFQNTEDERSRIAGELHDGINHELLSVKNQLIQGMPVEVGKVETIIQDVRNLSRDLHPAMFDNIGLASSIESLCDRLTNESELFTTCEIDYQEKISKQNELQLYRIVQEALNNTLKHGKAKAAKVTLTTKDNYLHLEVKDNGNGFDIDAQINNPKSFGIQSIFQRVKAIAGKLKIDSTSNGTIINITIPI